MKNPIAIACCVLALAGARDAWAHAFLDHASPRVGEALAHAPQAVTLWFTEPLEAAFSSVKVTDAQGKQVDRGDKALDSGDRTTMRVSLPSLAPGKYQVTWRAVSLDTHVTEGHFGFEVKP